MSLVDALLLLQKRWLASRLQAYQVALLIGSMAGESPALLLSSKNSHIPLVLVPTAFLGTAREVAPLVPQNESLVRPLIRLNEENHPLPLISA